MKHLLTMLALQHTAAVVLKRAAAATPQAFERATGLRVLHLSPAVVVVDKPTGLRSVPAYGPTRALLADLRGARRRAKRTCRPSSSGRRGGTGGAAWAGRGANFSAPRFDGLVVASARWRGGSEGSRRWLAGLPRTKSKFIKFCGGPAGGRLNLDEAEDAWQLLRAAVAQREAEEGMEESDSVLRRVQREAGFPEACPVHRLDYATSGCLAVALLCGADATKSFIGARAVLAPSSGENRHRHGRTSPCSGGKGPWTRPTRPWSRASWLMMKV